MKEMGRDLHMCHGAGVTVVLLAMRGREGGRAGEERGSLFRVRRVASSGMGETWAGKARTNDIIVIVSQVQLYRRHVYGPGPARWRWLWI